MVTPIATDRRAFGTSAPEMTVTVGSAYAGQAEVALGNVVGSNIFNVLFILGVSALIAPLVVAQQLVRFDVPLMIGASIATLLLALDGNIGRLDGVPADLLHRLHHRPLGGRGLPRLLHRIHRLPGRRCL